MLRMAKYVVDRTPRFRRRLKKLSDTEAKKKILIRIDEVENGKFGDSGGVGDKVSELRFMFGPGYRVYYWIKQGKIVLLLGGGIKDTQQDDINAAKQLKEDITKAEKKKAKKK
jgi:putative addiction module killer protein